MKAILKTISVFIFILTIMTTSRAQISDAAQINSNILSEAEITGARLSILKAKSVCRERM